MSISLSTPKEYQVTPKEAQKIRSKVYGLNRNNARFLWRTFYNNGILRVLRLDKW